MPFSCCQLVPHAADVVNAECDCCFNRAFVAKTSDMNAGYLSYCHFITVDWQTFFQRAQWLLDQVCLQFGFTYCLVCCFRRCFFLSFFIGEVVLILVLSTCAVLYTGNKVTINVGSLIDVSDLAPRCNCEGNELQQVQLAYLLAIYMHHTCCLIALPAGAE